jgi:hypothetical protein
MVSKKSPFWTGYLAINGSLQREIARKGAELVLQMRLPRTLGQMTLLPDIAYPVAVPCMSRRETYLPLKQVIPYIRAKIADATLGPGMFKSRGNYVLQQILLPECSGQMIFTEIFTIKEQLSGAI